MLVQQSPDGTIRIICVRGPRPTCSACHVATGTLQCDFPTGPGETCDRYLCGRCAVTQPPVFGQSRVDHCPGHEAGA